MAKQKISIQLALIISCLTFINILNAQNTVEGKISGNLVLNNDWDSVLYMSHIPSFDDMHTMSNEMIISKTNIDNQGYFEFNLDFLPVEENLFRLHIAKKGDSSASLIIGGQDKNHLFFIAHRHSMINFSTTSSKPPFRNVIFNQSNDNKTFKSITDLVYRSDSIASESTAAKRQFIENKTDEELLLIADTVSNPLTSLYAIYNIDFEYDYDNNAHFYKSYLKKWKKQDNKYFKVFREKLPIPSSKTSLYIYVLLAFVFTTVGFLFGKFGIKKDKRIKKLTVQERKIFNMLKEGASNQEISSAYNIGISTVKSHVSSILKKMNKKSRKELINI